MEKFTITKTIIIKREVLPPAIKYKNAVVKANQEHGWTAGEALMAKDDGMWIVMQGFEKEVTVEEIAW